MTRPTGLSRWQQTVSTYLPHLSRPQVTVLVLWSVGLILAHSCGLTTVATVLAYLLARREGAVREQLRDWYREAPAKNGAKRGRKRRTLDVATCFAPLLRWVVAWWDPACSQIALAMDASTLGQRFTILTISVVVRGCAIPVAWKVVEATRAGAWRPHWIALFEALDGSIPADWTVIVLADRGLYARWLFTTMHARGWHPYLRINRQGHYRPVGTATFRPLTQVVTRVGQAWAGVVTCFATPTRQLECTLLARWDAGYRDPWLVLTDLPPPAADVAWYGLRAWIECGYKDSKRGGWQWHQTKMTSPARRTTVAGDRGGHVVDGQCRLCGRGGAARAGAGGGANAARRPTPAAARVELLPPGAAGPDCGAVRGARTSARPVDPGTVAEKS